MTMPGRQLVDVAVTRYYHCIFRCVRRVFLCGEGVTHRKAWIEARLDLLANHFAISVCGLRNPRQPLPRPLPPRPGYRRLLATCVHSLVMADAVTAVRNWTFHGR